MTTVSDDLRRALDAEEAAEARLSRVALLLAEAEEAAEDHPGDGPLALEVELRREQFAAAEGEAAEARARRLAIERTLPPSVVQATHAVRVREGAG